MRFSVIASQQSTASGERSACKCIEAAERHGAAFHVGVHVQHALVRLQVRAAGIEANALADQAHGRGCGAAWPIGKMRNPGIMRAIAARDREKRARPQALQLRLAVELEA